MGAEENRMGKIQIILLVVEFRYDFPLFPLFYSKFTIARLFYFIRIKCGYEKEKEKWRKKQQQQQPHI